MDAVLDVRPEDLDCTVQAGVGWQFLNAELASRGLFFPVDPGAWAYVAAIVFRRVVSRLFVTFQDLGRLLVECVALGAAGKPAIDNSPVPLLKY
jgi:FAD/FMN-containing dehydrogenase